MSIRHLVKKLDLDLIARIESGWKPKDRVEPLRKVKPPREAKTYRGARRNSVLRVLKTVWRGAKPNVAFDLPRVRANRSRKWPSFKGRLYAHGAR